MELEVKKRLSILLPKKTMTVKTMKATSKRKFYTHIGMRLSTLNIRCPQMEMSAINTNTNTTKLVVYQIMIVIHSKFQGSAELAAILSFLTEMSPNFLVYLILCLSSFVLETEPMGPSRRGPVVLSSKNRKSIPAGVSLALDGDLKDANDAGDSSEALWTFSRRPLRSGLAGFRDGIDMAGLQFISERFP